MEVSKRKAKHDNQWTKLLKKLPWLLLIPLALILTHLAGEYPQTVERYYSSSVYPVISGAIGFVTSVIPFSLAEVTLFVAAATVVIVLIVNILMLVLRRRQFARFLNTVASIILIASILFFSFYPLWGLNYYRPQLKTLMRLEVSERSVDELESLCYRLVGQANTLRESVAENEDGVFSLEHDTAYYFEKTPDAYEKLGKKYNLFSQKVYPAKAVAASEAMSYAGISGIYIPFSAEANVNVDQPALLMLFGAVHENAHFLGFAPEDEANFVAYLACIESDEPAIAYSGTVEALIYCADKLYDADAEKYRMLFETYSEGIKRDVRDYNAYWKAFEGPVEEAATELNDSYLKFNQQSDGVKSYGMMVDLLLAYYDGGTV